MPPYYDLNKGRYSRSGSVYHLTVVSDRRLPLFADDLIAGIVAKELDSAEVDGLVRSFAWVLMPDHLHWLVQLDTGSLGSLMQRVKGRSSVRINRISGTKGKVWQRGYHDHALRQDEELRQTARYIIANPLRANLVQRIEDYRWWRAIWMEDKHGPVRGEKSL